MTWNIDDVPVFLAIIDCRGVSAAARQLAISKSAVSKSLARLEQALGVRLIERNSRNLRITSEGEAFYRHGQLIMEQVNETRSVMAGLTARPSGRLVVALPMAFSREIVAHHLNEFFSDYPQVELELMITSHQVDIIREQVDVAVVIGSLEDSELAARTLYSGRLLCVTSPGYRQQTKLEKSPDALLEHIRICEKRYASGYLDVRYRENRERIDLRRTPIQVNDPITVREAVVNGCGVSVIPDQYCRQQLDRGELVQVFDEIQFDTSASVLSVIYPSRRLISNKTRAFVDFLQRICSDMP